MDWRRRGLFWPRIRSRRFSESGCAAFAVGSGSRSAPQPFDSTHTRGVKVWGRSTADVTRYTFRDAHTRYVVSFEREETTLQAIFHHRMPLLKRIAARLMGFDGAYHRFTGKVTIEKFERSLCVERFDDRAIWDLMNFGKARPQALKR